MPPLSSVTGAAALLFAAFGSQAWAQTCYSYGMDYQNGGSYFINSLSTDAWTFVSQFEGCQTDVANNILVDPNGDELQCTNTNLTPNDVDQMSTCGAWSVLIISNNGNGDPIAYERDFSLTVGPQATSTYTPTVTLSATTTPLVNVTSTTTQTDTTVLAPVTITSPSKTLKPTTTVTPSRVTNTKTVIIGTITSHKYTLSILQATKTKTATCKTPTQQPTPDPTCKITPTLVKAAALETTTAASAKFRRVVDRRVPADRVQRIAERKARLAAARALEKRAPDVATTTVTDTNTADYVTTTSTSTAPAITLTVTSVTTITSTSTPSPVTVYSGKTTLSVVTVTAATPTRTVTRFTHARTVTTVTRTTTVTITTTTSPAASITACKRLGGILS
ncbi:hypothetical protein BJ546DRAFT_1069477 [Cryomyces antarcticus]